jgi:prophage DNA circulation protein
MVQAVSGETRATKAARRRLSAASNGVYALLSALERVMPAAAYTDALVCLARHPQDRVRRRALRLLADKAAALGSSDAAAVAAALRLCDALPELLDAQGGFRV